MYLLSIDETWIDSSLPMIQKPKKKKNQYNSNQLIVDPKCIGKILAFIFWKEVGEVFTDQMQQGKSMLGDCYCSVLKETPNQKFWKHVMEKFLKMNCFRKTKHLLVGLQKFSKICFKITHRPGYSPNLALSDYYTQLTFNTQENLKKNENLRQKRYSGHLV